VDEASRIQRRASSHSYTLWYCVWERIKGVATADGNSAVEIYGTRLVAACRVVTARRSLIIDAAADGCGGGAVYACTIYVGYDTV
jgi:hypothetical protein